MGNLIVEIEENLYRIYKMSRRPSIELTNLQSFINPLDMHLVEPTPIKPPAHLNTLVQRVQQSKKSNISDKLKLHSKPSGSITKKVHKR